MTGIDLDDFQEGVNAMYEYASTNFGYSHLTEQFQGSTQI